MSKAENTGKGRLRALQRRLRESPGAGEAPPAPGGDAAPLEEVSRALPPAPSRLARHLQRNSSGPRTAPRDRRYAETSSGAERALRGVETDTPHGTALVITERLEDRGREWAEVATAFRRELVRQDSTLRAVVARATGEDVPGPGDILFMDIETTGLDVVAPLFLIGALHWEADGLVARQYLARHYAEEAAAVWLYEQALARAGLLVTFNGKTFDLPFVRMRAAVHRLQAPPEPPHLDLLPVCRKAWRKRLPNCQLTTLEALVCGRERLDDVPGSAIPELYHEYVRTSNAALVLPILEHNILDLGTMPDLMLRLPPEVA